MNPGMRLEKRPDYARRTLASIKKHNRYPSTIIITGLWGNCLYSPIPPFVSMYILVHSMRIYCLVKFSEKYISSRFFNEPPTAPLKSHNKFMRYFHSIHLQNGVFTLPFIGKIPHTLNILLALPMFGNIPFFEKIRT